MDSVRFLTDLLPLEFVGGIEHGLNFIPVKIEPGDEISSP